jgi:Rnl2 family RNA ligase
MRFRMFPKLHGALPDGAPEGPYVALEKVHGAQLVVGLDTQGGISIGKRKAWLAADDAFFGWQLLRPELERAALNLRLSLRATGLAPPEAEIVLYGELFGGGYPHRAVPALGAFTPVQTGIWYAADLRFALFGVLITAREQGGGVLLGATDVGRLAEEVGLLSPPVLGRGSRAEVLALPERFPTRVPGLLGLPSIEGNVAEGFVVWLDRPTAFDSPAACKRKIPEMREAEFDGSEAFAPDRVLPAAELLAIVPRLVNRARLESAGSKVGFHDEAALLDEVELDVLIDLEAALPMTMRSLADEEERSLAMAIRTSARSALKVAVSGSSPALSDTRGRGCTPLGAAHKLFCGRDRSPRECQPRVSSSAGTRWASSPLRSLRCSTTRGEAAQVTLPPISKLDLPVRALERPHGDVRVRRAIGRADADDGTRRHERGLAVPHRRGEGHCPRRHPRGGARSPQAVLRPPLAGPSVT